ncbi:DUF58 domain-containing protein [Microbacterium excoecariae]|uniref:DUF58 domain-containing protein n=1 Tax=Microbacterium excoecariae TaxID=2715210 RepID=UPI00140DCDD9|nr:DUF58 domain-containing protein [Microbacterium excoecariae]NHI17592.1 DUF58 domain-containing protein [Microbacterium excoecariae]
MRRARGVADRTRLTPAGWGMLALGAALVAASALLARPELAVVGTALVAGAAAAVLVLRTLPLPRVAAVRLADDVVAVGDTTRAEADLSGRGPLAEAAVLRAGADVRVTDRDVAAGSLTPLVRGAHRVGPVEVRAVGPFGAARRRALRGAPATLLAVPAAVPLATTRDRAAHPGEGTPVRARLGQGSDDLIPRPYAHGDAMRRVHWRASAHHGDLMVREEERDEAPRAVVALDTRGSSWGDANAFEEGVIAAVSALARLGDDGYSADLVVGAERVPDAHQGAGRAAAWALLAAVERAEGDPAGVPRDAGTIVWIGSDPPPAPLAGLAIHLAPTDRGGRGWRRGDLRAGAGEAWAEAVGGRT